MKISIIIVVLLSCVPFLTCAQLNSKQVVSKYKANGVVPVKENRLKISVDQIRYSGNGEYEISVDIGASNPQGNVMQLDPFKDAETLMSKFYLLNAISPEENIPVQTEKAVYISSSISLNSFPLQGFGARITFSTNNKYVLLCFEGSKPELNKLDTPPLFFMIELNGKQSKLLDKKPYYLGKLKK